MKTVTQHTKRNLGEVWKDSVTGKYMVQFPKGRDGFKTKKLALAWSAALLVQK